MKVFRLKSELCWVLHENGIEVFYNNEELNKIIYTSDNDKVFSFLNFLSDGQTKNKIKSYKGLSETEKNELLNFLIEKKYGLWEITHSPSRTEFFINSFPDINFIEHKEEISKLNIVIVGLGTAGSYLLELLTKLGFKNFILIDGDKVQEKNLDSQNYKETDIGHYKAEVLAKKYNAKTNISYFNNYVKSFYELSDISNIENADYIINCADQLTIMQSLLEAKIRGEMDAILIESGYGILQQTAYMIKDVAQAKKIKDSLDSIILDSKRWIVNNNGSIFNAFFSSFAISKMIFDNIIDVDNTECAIGDYLQNRYFIGSKNNNIYFNEYSKLIQANMKYKHKVSSHNPWIPTITEENIFTIKPNYDITNDLSLYEKEFLFKNSTNKLFETAEYRAENIKISSQSITDYEEEVIMKLITEYIGDNFGANLLKRAEDTLINHLIERKNYNTKEQNKTTKIGNTWILFNTNYNNIFDKILGRLHELFHIIYWNITSNVYEHERFVMEHEIQFFSNIRQKYDSINNIIKYYSKMKLLMFAKNYTISHFEKAIITDQLSNFQITFNDLTKNRLKDLVRVLNSELDYNKPFSQLKYLNAFEKNQYGIESLISNMNL